ncbi:hypothetical protein C8J57DRAFT_1520994 [Mycena rebaudengoi]|nr:hypothetical protein C8J57DRAFT_1520994 [Mycena rebaudengoi]
MPNNRCSNCISFNSECILPRKEPKLQRQQRAADTQQKEPDTNESISRSTSTLEKTKESVDAILSETTTYQPPKERKAVVQLLVEVSRYTRHLEQELASYQRSHSPPTISQKSFPPDSGEDLDAENESGIVVDILAVSDDIGRLVPEAANGRFFGKRGNLVFVKEAFKVPEKGPGVDPTGGQMNLQLVSKRPEHWTSYVEFPLELPTPQHFPPDDLLRDLIEIYFTQMNIFTLILHRPTFEKAIADGLHLLDHQFGATVLAVCALASKNSLDPRIMLTGAHGELSAGWEWFRQIRRPFTDRKLKATSLYELQLCCLCIMFHQSGTDFESCWLQSGIGILHAQDIGIHQLTSAPNAQSEMFKRCFYFLCSFDAIVSACLGRHRIATSPLSDLGLPIACDDEYWEHADASRAFKQPPGKPPLAAYTVAHSNLMTIFTLDWRATDSIENFRGQRLLDPDTISELDSRLNKWTETIPEHLLWNPFMEDDVFFDQSANLYATYYTIQMLIHRPFINPRAPDRIPSAPNLKSLAICTSAARACSHIADVKCTRGFMPSPQFLKAAFDSAIVLVLGISAFRRAGLPINADRELLDVYKCMTLIRQCERRSQTAGRFSDILSQLMISSQCNLPVSLAEGAFEIWTGKGGDQTNHIMTPDYAWSNNSVSLPLGADDLSGLPMYGSLDFPSGFSFKSNLPHTEPPLKFLSSSTEQEQVPLRGEMNLNEYFSHWAAYSSSVDEIAHALQNASPG